MNRVQKLVSFIIVDRFTLAASLRLLSTVGFEPSPIREGQLIPTLWKFVSKADGYQPHLIAPEQDYRRLIEGSLNCFRGPAEASVDAVHFVLRELVRKSIGETEELRRFATLQSALAAAGEALEKFRDESKKTVVRLVEMESSYLTVDFFQKLPQEGEKMGPTPSPGDRRTSSADRRNPPGSDCGIPRPFESI
ncbi:dynamin-related protein 1C-like [Helianthus annuus]|uniref:dynamin-related protein 1C-like n=1 Tax=Helianthus annuus TaxID=4232 RepID=UPI000B8FAEF7|nr:dynamin-related protein 1C-like [Helianthus annuus]